VIGGGNKTIVEMIHICNESWSANSVLLLHDGRDHLAAANTVAKRSAGFTIVPMISVIGSSRK